MSEHVVPVRVYVANCAALLALTAVTVAVAYIDLGPLNTVAAIGIAGLKAFLVILYFMHLRYSPRLVWMVVAAGVLFVFLLLALVLADYESRGWLGFAGK